MVDGSFSDIYYIEEQQCETCRFRKDPYDDGQHAEDYPMCYEVEGAIMAEDGPVAALDKTPDGAIVCRKYRPGNPEDFVVDPDQLELFKESHE